MKHLNTSLFAVAMAALLSACGGTDPQTGAGLQTAAVMQADTAQAQGGALQNPATQPQPDCAPEGCNGLRIIDANAEAYRFDKAEREKLEAAAQAGASASPAAQEGA